MASLNTKFKYLEFIFVANKNLKILERKTEVKFMNFGLRLMANGRKIGLNNRGLYNEMSSFQYCSIRRPFIFQRCN